MTRRITIVAPDYAPAQGGYSHACTAFARALAEHPGFDVTVVTPSVEGGIAPDTDETRLTVHRVPRRHLNVRLLDAANVGTERNLRRYVRELARDQRPDWILLETAEYPLTALGLLRDFGVARMLVRIHAASETEWARFRQDVGYQLKRWPTGRVFREMRYILSTTPYYLDWVRTHYLRCDPLLAASKRFGVVPNVTLTESSLAPKPERTADGPIELLTLGRMDRHGELQKNFGRLIAAIRIARAEGDDIRLRVVGSGEMREPLMAYAANLGLNSAVRFDSTLTHDEVQERQRKCDAVLLGSTFEGMSMFALEALSNGAPLLVSRAGGLDPLIADGVNGFRFDALDPVDSANVMKAFARQEPRSRAAMAAASRRLFETSFTRSVVVSQFATLLETFEHERATPQLVGS